MTIAALSAPTAYEDPRKTLIRTMLRPQVVDIDLKGVYPRDFLRRLGALGGFGGLVDPRFGGNGAGAADVLATIEDVSRECVTTGFLVWCQSTCCWYLNSSTNQQLRDHVLPAVVRANQLAGTGLSNTMKSVSRIEPMRVRARRVADGYILNGSLSWISNMAEDHYIAIGAELEEGGNAFVLVHGSTPGVGLSTDARYAGLEGSLTVAMRLRDAFISDAFVIAHPGDEFVPRVRVPFILTQIGMALGLVGACVDAIEKETRNGPASNRYIDDQAPELRLALQSLRDKSYQLARSWTSHSSSLRETFRLRAEASELALRAASAALLHAGGKGYLLRHAAQRRLREAYFIAIVTPALKHLRYELAKMGG
jgi:alkylation response protein AidB-like acyl-CoA dehydrogenase